MITDNELFNRLTPHDLNLIRAYIHAYAGSDGDWAPDFKSEMDYILRFWSNNKENLAKTIFRDGLILTKKVSFTKSESMMYDEIQNCVFDRNNPKIDKFLDTFYEKAEDIIATCIDNTLDEDDWRRKPYPRLSELLWYEHLVPNKFDNYSFSIPNPKNGKTIEVNRGCKVSKVLGKIAEAYDIPNFEDFRIAHSMALNQKRLEGELCISIHPLDYMTMSDNNCDWDSCMSWQQPGDYRQGTVEMMNSEYIVVAYLKSNEDMSITWSSNDEWNSKKWRQLFIVSPDLIMGIRQYPYENDELRGLVAKWLRELAMRSGYGVYTENACLFNNRKATPIAELNITPTFIFNMNKMYNDIGQGHFGYPSVNLKYKDYLMNLSGPSECMTCGKDCSWADDIGERELCCSECEGKLRCEECGSYIDLYYTIEFDGSYYCECCYSDITRTCSCCEERHYDSDMIEVFAKAPTDKGVDDYFGHGSIYLCEDCVKRGKTTPIDGIGLISVEEDTVRFWTDHIYVVDMKNFTDEGFDMFRISTSARDVYRELLKAKENI